jgi:hypothetical protein
MKRFVISTLIIAFVILFAGCTKDNYDPPKSFLTGSVVYNGNPVGVRSNGTELELWQYGFALRQKIPVYIAQNGTFSTILFDGNYKLVRKVGAPWADQTDSIDVTVNGKTEIEVPVTPHFTITEETFNNTAGVITSSCKVTKVGTKNIQSLTLYVGITNIVDANNSSQTNLISASGLTDLSTPKNHTITLSAANAARNYIYVRIGVQTSGVGERLYTPVQKITLN